MSKQSPARKSQIEIRRGEKISASINKDMQEIQQQVARRAYEKFCGDGGVPGREAENWLAAEREIGGMPAVELKEKEDRFEVQVAIPGVESKDIYLEVTPEQMIVSCEMNHEHTTKGETVHLCEFVSGKIFRAVGFPKRINPDKTKAEIRNGMLILKAELAVEIPKVKISRAAAKAKAR
jgi:HSP20 family molecular chaperone IbpA